MSDETVTCAEQRDLDVSEEYIKECLIEIKEWLISENRHLKVITVGGDETGILLFLKAAKYNLEEAKRKLSEFLEFTSTTPEWFEARDPLLPQVQSLLKTGVFLPLLRRGEGDGRLTVLIRTGRHDPDRQRQDDVFKVGLMVLDLALTRLAAAPTGSLRRGAVEVAAIFDMADIGQGHAAALNINIIRKAVTSWQVYPVKIKRLDFINSPSYINVVLNIFKAFMSSKLKEKVYVHGNGRELLDKIVPREILPHEYGGTNGTLQQLIDYWEKEVLTSREWFLRLESK